MECGGFVTREGLESPQELRTNRGAIADSADQSRLFHQRAHRIGRNHVEGKSLGQTEARCRGLDRREHVVRAVLREVVVAVEGRAEFPDVGDQHRNFVGSEIEVVAPEITRLEVVVLANFVIVRHRGERAAKAAHHSEHAIENRIGSRDDSRVVDAEVHELIAIAAGSVGLFAIDSHE